MNKTDLLAQDRYQTPSWVIPRQPTIYVNMLSLVKPNLSSEIAEVVLNIFLGRGKSETKTEAPEEVDDESERIIEEIFQTLSEKETTNNNNNKNSNYKNNNNKNNNSSSNHDKNKKKNITDSQNSNKNKNSHNKHKREISKEICFVAKMEG